MSSSKPNSAVGKTSKSSKPSAPVNRNFARPFTERGKKNQSLISGFGNAGAIFGEETEEELHPQVIKMARKSGQLNLSNRGMSKIPKKVFHLNELDLEEQKKVTINMSLDSNEDRWWEQVDLTRLLLSSNALATIDPLISNLASLQLLDLTDNRLVSLPSEMRELKCLTKLMLSHNDLKELPDDLCQMEDLRILLVDHNNLNKLPDSIDSFCVLEQLDASHNAIQVLPPSIGYLQRLSKLNLSDNNLHELPLEIGDLFGLVHFDLTRNKLKELPTCLGNLPKLEELALRQNQLTSLPALKCPNLKELYLGANRIKTLDEDKLETLTSLRVLDVSDNGIDALPDQITLLQLLQRLDLTNNYLSTIPNHLGLLQHLRAMPLEGNPLRLIRRDIVQRGTTQLLKYLVSKLEGPPSSYPGFANYVPVEELREEKTVPDQYEMRNMRAMVYNMKVAQIPEELFENGKLAQVRTADLSQNLLSEVPDKLSDLSSHLHELILNHNCLTSLPEALSELKHLQFLDVQNNKLNSLPASLPKLQDLREINISYNKFEILPKVIYDLANLEILFAGDNKIKEIDAEKLVLMSRLATLDLHNNDINFVPPLLGKATQLNSLQLEGNAFRVPRHDIMAKGCKAVLEYLRSRIVEK